MTIPRHHAEWLSLVETSGPFLSLPVLLRVFPQGLSAHDPEHFATLKQAFSEWEANRDSRRPDPGLHREWVRFVLRQTLGLPESTLVEGPALPASLAVEVRNHPGETLRPTLAVVNPPGGPNPGHPRLLVSIVPPGQDLDRQLAGSSWIASPATRMADLLRGTGVSLGLVTNGEQWMLVSALPDTTSGYASWYATVWQEESVTLRAFRDLLGCDRFFGMPDGQTLESLLQESAANQQEVTDQLGYQVRRAVEVLIQCLDRIDRNEGQTLLLGVDEKTLYEAALTVMMRLVFLFSAEERELLGAPGDAYQQHYAVSPLGDRLRELADRHGEEILERRHDAWAHLLATFRAIHGGMSHDRMTLMARGGGLFDPDRYPFLEGRPADTKWETTPARPLPIDNRTVLHLLNALQVLEVRVPGGGPAEARRLSFRALGVEQIGHVYEKLLDHTAVRAQTVVLGLAGAKDREPEVPLADLEARRVGGLDTLADWLHERTGRSKSALRKALDQAFPLDDRRLEVACAGTVGLRERVAPYGTLLRPDSFGYPVVIHDHGVYVTTGTDRRTSGTHYTPPSLTEPIVEHALEPLVYQGMADGVPPSQETLQHPAGILALRVCDMACGSGAFLVQACRYLADRLVESWSREEVRYPDRVLTAPLGRPSAGATHEVPIPADPDERRALARRIVAERCLYGVDKNPLAVEIAKLSLWLVTLARDQAFTFLDHAIRSGDSLLGVTSPEQVLAFHLDMRGDRHLAAYSGELQSALDEATRLRQQIESFVVRDIVDAQDKARLLREADERMRDLRRVCDALVAGNLSTARPGRLDYDRVLYGKVSDLMKRTGLDLDAHRAEIDQRARRLLDTDLPDGEPSRRPFHWGLEFPEVFGDKDPGRRGFDAIVGNPPFQMGKKISGALGACYRNCLVESVASGCRGNADLCSYFFLRAHSLVRVAGSYGLVATNTISQGDTLDVGLAQICGHGDIIVRTIPSAKWPGDASLEVAMVWIHRGEWLAPHLLNNLEVSAIAPTLSEQTDIRSEALSLAENAGCSFIGSFPRNIGFILDLQDAQALIDKDYQNRDVVLPYLIADDLNKSPTQSASRAAIFFWDWPLDKCAEYRDCIAVVRARVKDDRERLASGSALDRDHAKRWWQFAMPRMNMYAGLGRCNEVLVTSRVSAHHFVALVPSRQVFSDRLVVFSLTDRGHFAVLSSSVHEVWAHRPGTTTHETRSTYFPERAFETFAAPHSTSELRTLGDEYHTTRKMLMAERQEGLTKTYNRFHDPSEVSAGIARLRAIHVEIDQAVVAAYGWTDLDLGHGFHETKQGVRYTLSESARREVLARLLRLNQERHEAEVKAGLADDKGPIARRVKKAKARKSGRDDQPTLF